MRTTDLPLSLKYYQKKGEEGGATNETKKEIQLIFSFFYFFFIFGIKWPEYRVRCIYPGETGPARSGRSGVSVFFFFFFKARAFFSSHKPFQPLSMADKLFLARMFIDGTVPPILEVRGRCSEAHRAGHDNTDTGTGTPDPEVFRFNK